MDSIVPLEGTIIEFNWRQPHAYIVMETEQDGEPASWVIEMGAPNVLSRRGWEADSLSPGDKVFVRGHPWSGRNYAKLQSIETLAGEPVVTHVETRTSQEKATSLAGKWMADRELYHLYPGGFDGFFNAYLELTDKGQRGKDSFDALSEENPESTCIGRRTPAALVSTWIYLMEIDLSEADEKNYLS